MSLTPVRSYTRLAIAIVIAAVVISASILSYSSFESTVTRTGTSDTTTATTTLTVVDISTFATTVTSTQTTTCIEGVVTSSTLAFEGAGTGSPVGSVIPLNSTHSCQLGVTLGVAAYPTLSMGQNETVYVSLSNDFATPNDVNYTGLPVLPHGFVPRFGIAGDYTLPISDGCLWPSSAYEPAFIAIYNESGAPVQLNGSPPSISYCPALPNYHSFNASQTITETLSIGGSWTSSNSSEPWINAAYSQFSPGNYTVVAFDPWGQLAELNFQVGGISLQDFSLCPSDCLYPSPYLTGEIYLGGSSPLKSLQLIVNGTDEGVQTYGPGTNIDVILIYKGGFQNPQVIRGEAYVLRFVATFEDNSTASAMTTVVAE
jgi:hypothetical protein